ncbi:MAG: toxin-antitoxin system HicB family antitoxin [Candidatus Babeliales bacterium]
MSETSLTIRLPDKLHKQLSKIAYVEGRSLNKQIVKMLEKTINGTARLPGERC